MLTSNDVDELINSDLEFSDREAIKLLFYIDFSNIKNMRASFSVSKAQSVSHAFGFLLLDFLVKYFENGLSPSFPDKSTEKAVLSELDSVIPLVYSNSFIKERYGTFVALIKKIHRRAFEIAFKTKTLFRTTFCSRK